MTQTTIKPNRWIHLAPALIAVLFVASCGKEVTPAPKPQSPPPFEFLGSWGDKGEDPGKFNEPVAIATDSLSNVFFADPAADFVDKFESRGTPLLSFEDPQLHHASGIAVDSGGAIYIADAKNGRILIFFPNGTFLRAIHFPPQPHFSGPLGISVDDEGNIYVIDPKSSRVDKFNRRGGVVKFWTAREHASDKSGPSSVAAAQDGSVFVAYFTSGRIEKYSSGGAIVTSWNTSDPSSGESQPVSGFAVGGSFIFTMTAKPKQIRVWTLDGQHKLDGDLGNHTGEIAAPQIAVTPRSELLVFDPSTSRVFRFQMHLDMPGQQ